MELEERISLFREMVLCCHNLYFWTFDMNLNLLETNCPEAEIAQHLFLSGDSRKTLLTYAGKHGKPIIMTNSFGLMWAAVPHSEGEGWGRIFILGPFFSSDLTDRMLANAISGLRPAASVRRQAESLLRSLPILSQSRCYEYVIMLYYCITGERITVSDMHYQESEEAEMLPASAAKGHADIHGTYAMEQEMVRMVREGNLGIQKHMSRIAITGNIGKLSSNPLQQMKNAVLVCIVLFSRAAIEGGLSPEISMTIADHYFQSVETCKNLQELQTLARTMQDDYVTRVHRIRSSALSRPIREACDYIDLHLEENPSIGRIAEHTKYSESYLCRRFKEETGSPVGTYVMCRRLERAADLLLGSRLTVREISERLNFCSPSNFSSHFKSVYGCVPSEWLKKKGVIGENNISSGNP